MAGGPFVAAAFGLDPPRFDWDAFKKYRRYRKAQIWAQYKREGWDLDAAEFDDEALWAATRDDELPYVSWAEELDAIAQAAD